MTALLHKRIKRIETEVTAPVATRSNVAILTEPREGAEPAEVNRHEKELAKAIAKHDKVIVVSTRYSERTAAGDGLVYVPTEIQALIERLSTAQTTGSRTASGDDAAWLASIRPSLVGVAPQAAKPNYRPLD